MSDFKEVVRSAYDAAPELIIRNGQMVAPGSAQERGINGVVFTDEQGAVVDPQALSDDFPIVFPDTWQGEPHQIITSSVDELHGVLAEIADQFFGGKTAHAQHILGGQLNHEMQHVEYAQTYFDVEGILIAVNVFRIPEDCGFTTFPGAIPVGLNAGVHYVGGSATKLDFSGASGKPLQLSVEDKAIVNTYYGSLEALAAKLKAAGRPLPNSITMLQKPQTVAKNTRLTAHSGFQPVSADTVMRPQSESAGSSESSALGNVAQCITRAVAMLPVNLQDGSSCIQAATDILQTMGSAPDNAGTAEIFAILESAAQSLNKAREQLQQGRNGLETYLGNAGLAVVRQQDG